GLGFAQVAKRRLPISATLRTGGERSIHQQALHLTAEREQPRVDGRRTLTLAEAVVSKGELAIGIRSQGLLLGATGEHRFELGEARERRLAGAVATSRLGQDHAGPTGHPQAV